MRSRSRCNYYNGDSAPRLEASILEYLGQYNDPKQVRKLLDASEKREFEKRERELAQADRSLAGVEADFSKNMDLLKRNVLNEEEFRRANEAGREARAWLEATRAELIEWLGRQRERQDAVNSLPTKIGSFLHDFESLDTCRAKALLQTILNAALIYRDGRIELEFRN